ncbi:MAG: efflux transporter outer membrane subunit [Pseudomonadota bacterium]
MKTLAMKLTPMLAALVLAACSTVPELKAPQIEMPLAFKEAAAPRQSADGKEWKLAQPAEARARGEWWLAFNDPALTALVHEATRANANLAVAAARVKQARALAGTAQADRGVQLGAGLGVSRSRPSALALGLPEGSPVAAGSAWQASLGASYELDLFGRVGANVGAARADAEAAGATYKSVLLALQADVAQTYFRLRETDAELATLNRTVELRQQSVKVNQSRYDNGDIGEFDLARAKTELSSARAEAIGAQRKRVQGEHALAVLLGAPASMFALETKALPDVLALPQIPAGLPSTLLERRPDIAAAQNAMVAANARIGVAKSAMFPSLLLTADGGGASEGLSNLFKWSSRSWMLGALLNMPLLDGGRNKANISRSEAVLEESVASYRQSVLVAFAEVEDNLAGLRILAGQAEQIDAAVVSARRSAELADKLHRAGRSSYLDLLDAQRNLASIERNAVQLRGSQAVTTVALIRSLGGAWN